MGWSPFRPLISLTLVLIRDILVGLATELGLDPESAGSVVHGHDHLDELDLVGFGECLVVEQVRKLGLGADEVRLASFTLDAAKDFEQLGPFPKYR